MIMCSICAVVQYLIWFQWARQRWWKLWSCGKERTSRQWWSGLLPQSTYNKMYGYWWRLADKCARCFQHVEGASLYIQWWLDDILRIDIVYPLQYAVSIDTLRTSQSLRYILRVLLNAVDIGICMLYYCFLLAHSLRILVEVLGSCSPFFFSVL